MVCSFLLSSAPPSRRPPPPPPAPLQFSPVLSLHVYLSDAINPTHTVLPSLVWPAIVWVGLYACLRGCVFTEVLAGMRGEPSSGHPTVAPLPSLDALGHSNTVTKGTPPPRPLFVLWYQWARSETTVLSLVRPQEAASSDQVEPSSPFIFY